MVVASAKMQIMKGSQGCCFKQDDNGGRETNKVRKGVHTKVGNNVPSAVTASAKYKILYHKFISKSQSWLNMHL